MSVCAKLCIESVSLSRITLSTPKKTHPGSSITVINHSFSKCALRKR